MTLRPLLASLCLVTLTTCASPEGTGLARTPEGAGAKVRFDAFHKPLPEVPLPNDFATRFDPTSPTKRRLNASMLAPTEWEQKTRKELDALDGWGTLGGMTVAFDGPALDTENIIKRHHGDRFDTHDDVILVIDVTPGSPDYCKAAPLDLGEGHFPQRLDRPEYYPDDPRASLQSLVFEEVEEDANGNGVMDPGEDSDMDGVLDHPNTRSATDKSLLTFYERETSTLIARPVYPLREATTYAVVLTKNLLDVDGHPVRSPFRYVNHTSQTAALQPLATDCLQPLGFQVEDIAFSWSFTTQAWTKPLVAVRDGLYGLGPLARLATEFPADMVIRDGRDRGATEVNRKIVPNALFVDMAKSLYSQFGSGNSTAQENLFFDNFNFIDFHAAGTIDSPQFFPRFLEDGKTQQKLTDQVWQLDPLSGEAFVRHEGVNYWLMVPRHRNGPAPLAIFIHGHGSTKFDALNVAGFLARMGIATMGIDAPSHGVGVDPVLLEVVRGQFKQRGIEGLGLGIVEGRALDQNGDGRLDSGADYWTAYLFHTRDMVRQTGVDLFQVIRVLKGFDGVKRWKYDTNLDGQPDLAGDFDGDGVIDVGGSAPIHLIGGSLGGIISSYVGGLEPQVETVIPIIGGGGLADIGVRSALSGVRDAMVLRMMGPLFLLRDGKVIQASTDLAEYTEVEVATLAATPKPGSIAVLENLTTGEWRCARVQPNGRLRVSVSSDQGNQLAISFYDHELPSREREGCEPDGAPVERVSAWQKDVKFQTRTFTAGSPLVAVSDGYGLRRGNPEIRRMMGLGQIALEGADPANTAPFMHGDRTLTYGTGETVSTRAFYIQTLGDPGVPTSSGVLMTRAAGLVNFRDVDARYGKTVQQVLLDTGTVEGTESSLRYLDSTGKPVLMDVDNLANLSSVGDGFDAPRLSPPLRIIRDNTAAQGGGKSAVLFPMMDPQGVHGFPQPKPEKAFDLGSLLINQMTRYLATHGEQLDFNPCQLDWSCSWLPPIQN